VLDRVKRLKVMKKNKKALPLSQIPTRMRNSLPLTTNRLSNKAGMEETQEVTLMPLLQVQVYRLCRDKDNLPIIIEIGVGTYRLPKLHSLLHRLRIQIQIEPLVIT